jgi:hypothetical protein
MVSKETQMSECSVASELLNANERGERDAFSSDDSIVDRKCKPSSNESESSTEVIITINNYSVLCCVLNIWWCEQ